MSALPKASADASAPPEPTRGAALRLRHLALRLCHGDFGVIHQFLRERSFLLQRNPVFIQLLRGVHTLLRGVQILLRGLNIGLGFAPVLAHGRTRQALIGGLGLFVLVFALLGSRG